MDRMADRRARNTLLGAPVIYSKLMKARMALHSREIKKSGRNTFAGYNYMELGDFLIPVQTIFAELGLCGIVSFTADTASLTLIDTEDGSQHIITSPMGSAALKGCHEVQNIGAVETYQRRYLWMAALEIVEHDAIDGGPPKTEAVKGSPAKATDQDFTANPKREAFDKLQPEVQDFLRRVAPQVAGAIPDVPKAIEIAEMACDDWPELDRHELKKGLWHLLDSKTRSAIDKAQKERQ
jgi:hypothetical protein